MQALEQMLHEKSWGEAFLLFLAYFYPKLGGKFTKVGGKFIVVSCFQLVSRRGVKFGGGASNAILMNNEKYTRSVSLRNLCDYPPPPPRSSVQERRKSTLGL